MVFECYRFEFPVDVAPIDGEENPGRLSYR